MQTAQESFSRLPLNAIIPGNNPRRHFDAAELDELTASVKARGVVQPILVRPVGDKFQIVAGERRYRASLVAFGPEGSIPAVVKPLSDEEAEVEALIENIHRADMSVTEEARAAGKCLARNKGDRDETARVLGWPMVKLARRLALLNLTEEVMTALDERKIQTGHAELLATVTQEKQNAALERIIKHSMTVQFVRENIIKKSTKMADAVFDASSCTACQYNSERQASLFAENIGEGFCTNGDCYAEKTAQHLESIRASLTDEFSAVRIIEAGDNISFASLSADGELGVGEEQYAACKGCGDFGATVSNVPGEVGTVTRSICFNVACQQKKIAERIKAEKEASAPIPPTTLAHTGTSAASEAPVATSTSNPLTDAPKKKPAPNATASEASSKVKEYRRQVWNKLAKIGFAADPEKSMSLLLDLALSGDIHHIDRHILAELYKKIAGEAYPKERVFGLNTVTGLPENIRGKLLSAMAVTTIDRISEKQVVEAIAFLGTAISDHWQINKEFLDLLTKSEIESIAVEVGLDAAMGDSFKKALSGKKDDLVKAILAAEFTWKGAVPKVMTP